MVGGIDACKRRQRALDRLDRVDDVRAGNLEHDEKDARLAIAPRGLRRVLRSRDRLADVAHAHRRPVAIGDDDVVPVLGLGQLVVVLDGEGLLRTDERALGAVDGRDADLRAHVLELQPLFDELRRIDLDADGRRLLAADAHEGDARDLAEVLGEDVFGGVVDVDDRRDVRLDGQDEDRRVGRVDLAIGRRARQILRQLPGGGVDRGLDVVGGGVDVAVEIELDGDRRRAERTRRRHLRDAWNLRDLPFERLRDRGRHRVRGSARQRSRDGDGRKVDLRQGRNRQRRESDEADQKHRDHDERGRDRAVDEGGGEALVHRLGSASRVDRNDRPGLKQELTGRHHAVALLQALRDDGRRRVLMRDLHLTHLSAVLIVDDKDIKPVLAMLHHFSGDNQDVLLHPELQAPSSPPAPARAHCPCSRTRP